MEGVCRDRDELEVDEDGQGDAGQGGGRLLQRAGAAACDFPLAKEGTLPSLPDDLLPSVINAETLPSIQATSVNVKLPWSETVTMEKIKKLPF